jgi:hypothetical protein
MVMAGQLVSIKIRLDTKAEIEASKVHPRETIDDVIRRLLAESKKVA